MNRPLRSSAPPQQLVDVIVARLDRYISSITSRSVITVAARRAGVSPDSLNRTGLTPRVIDEMMRALRMYVRDPADLQRCRRVLETLETPQPAASISGFEVRIEREQDIVEARGRVRDMAAALGFSHTDQIRIATSVSEASRNIYSYARKGTVSAGRAVGGKVGIWIRAVDDGPGIPNLEEILSGGYKSKTGMGLGLLACKQLMDTFRVVTGPGLGTRISMEKFV